MDIELFYTPRTRAGRVRWALEEPGMPYRLRPVELFSGERNPAHPLGSVPAIKVDGQAMFESGAICHWLADRFPGQGLAPVPGDARRRKRRSSRWLRRKRESSVACYAAGGKPDKQPVSSSAVCYPAEPRRFSYPPSRLSGSEVAPDQRVTGERRAWRGLLSGAWKRDNTLVAGLLLRGPERYPAPGRRF